eukprot:13396761-Alexandrium_andersonii.AAC.1
MAADAPEVPSGGGPGGGAPMRDGAVSFSGGTTGGQGSRSLAKSHDHPQHRSKHCPKYELAQQSHDQSRLLGGRG